MSSHVVLSLLFSAHGDGMIFFCACSEPPVIERGNYLSPVSTHRVPCFFVALMECSAIFWAHSDGLSNARLCFSFCSRPPVIRRRNYLGRVS